MARKPSAGVETLPCEPQSFSCVSLKGVKPLSGGWKEAGRVRTR